MPGFALTLGFCSCLRFKKDESSRWGGDLVSGPVELRRALRSASVSYNGSIRGSWAECARDLYDFLLHESQ